MNRTVIGARGTDVENGVTPAKPGTSFELLELL